MTGLLIGLVLLVAACDPSSGDAASGSSCGEADVTGEGRVVALYEVSDAVVGRLCTGTDSPALLEAWGHLVEVAPPAELAAISALAGFESAEGDTAAFTSPLGGSNRDFVVAVNLSAVADDPAEARLTLVHELAHVFTLEPDQVDTEVEAEDCPTYHDGYGCFRPGSYVQAWVSEFWSLERLAALPADGSVDEEAGEEACSIDPTFLGGYAASHPEEDFAESFAAYVFDIEVPLELSPKLEFFDSYPELAEFRSRAATLGETHPNNFGECG